MLLITFTSCMFLLGFLAFLPSLVPAILGRRNYGMHLFPPHVLASQGLSWSANHWDPHLPSTPVLTGALKFFKTVITTVQSLWFFRIPPPKYPDLASPLTLDTGPHLGLILFHIRSVLSAGCSHRISSATPAPSHKGWLELGCRHVGADS